MRGHITITWHHSPTEVRCVKLDDTLTVEDVQWMLDDDDARVAISEQGKNVMHVLVRSNKMVPGVGSELDIYDIKDVAILTPYGGAFPKERKSFVPLEENLPTCLEEFE